MAPDKNRFPQCAVHEERLKRLEARVSAIDESLVTVMAELCSIHAILGRAPDPVAGTAGSGIALLLHRIANVVLTGEVRGPMESLLDDESEITKVQDRPALIRRSRDAEAKGRKAVVAAWAAGIVLVIGALAGAATQIIPLLR